MQPLACSGLAAGCEHEDFCQSLVPRLVGPLHSELMSRSRPALVLALALVLAGAAPAWAADRKPPKIASAAMKDADRDGRADRASFPFTVTGYGITKVKRSARNTKLVICCVRRQRAT